VGRTIGIIQARAGSTRLPGKVLAPLAGTTILGALVSRTARAAVDEWWLATTDRPEDDDTAAEGRRLGLRIFRGSVEDVLSRFTAVVREVQPEIVVRLTADDPYTDGVVIDLLLRSLGAAGPSVALVGDEGETRHLPLGYVPEAVRAGALLQAETAIGTEQAWHRTHVTSWLREHGLAEPLAVPAGWPSRPAWRWTVDTGEDLEAARAAFARFGERWSAIGYPEMAVILDAHPEVMARNAGVRQKAVDEG